MPDPKPTPPSLGGSERGRSCRKHDVDAEAAASAAGKREFLQQAALQQPGFELQCVRAMASSSVPFRVGGLAELLVDDYKSSASHVGRTVVCCSHCCGTICPTASRATRTLACSTILARRASTRAWACHVMIYSCGALIVALVLSALGLPEGTGMSRDAEDRGKSRGRAVPPTHSTWQSDFRLQDLPSSLRCPMWHLSSTTVARIGMLFVGGRGPHRLYLCALGLP